MTGELLPLVYDELRWLAAQPLVRESPGQTLQATALVHEAYLRLVGGDPDRIWNGRTHFLAAAAEAMRHILVDAARIRIPAEYNKSDADQWIPLHPELAEILAPLRSDRGRIFRLGLPRRVSQKFGPLALKAGLRITLHDLRRSFGSRYAAVVPAQVLQRLMRHANIRTTLEFYTDLDDALDEAIRKA